MIEIGNILYQKTSDEIRFDLEGNFETINEHEEPWLVLDIKKDVYLLFNLKNQRKYKMHEKELSWLLIHERIRVSEEVG